MDVIEFLKQTDHRNLKRTIDYLVKQKLHEGEVELNKRRQRLKRFLEEESHGYEEELSLLLKARTEELEGRRHEFIGFMRLERERAEAELLELKKRQLQLENAEEVRHIYSREMLLDSKQAQLYQIEEKKALREKSKQMDHLWLEAMQKYTQENEDRLFEEQSLRKNIANIEQQKNLDHFKAMKIKTQDDARTFREEQNQELNELNEVFFASNVRAFDLEKKYKRDEEFYEWRKKVYNRDVLKRQIHSNSVNREIQVQTERNAENVALQQVQHSILTELDQKGAEVVKNRALQKVYLQYIGEEKNLQREQDKLFDDMVKGSGCVLEQRNKRPYGKNTR